LEKEKKMAIENKVPGKDVLSSDLIDKFPLVAKQSTDHISKFKISGVEFGGSQIPVFAGPNMVESEELIHLIAKDVKSSGAHFLRGGAFKPLSFPYRSEKYNETRHDGLKWIYEAGKEVGIPIITEIMDQRLVEDIAEYTDIIQIGSRNMQNYPLLTECAKTGIPLMLKRHYGASLRDWLGAAEYLMVEGNSKIILCERGMSIPHTHRETSRFSLDLQVIPAAKELTHLPIVTDPSHATFWNPWVKSMSLASVACGADGVMLEVHPDPKNAAVDPLQPLNFSEFQDVITSMDVVARAVGRNIF
jgi:3-deoxy-7-phosphoheptulonate synthase